jgi:putative phosphoribosyl transferase
MRFRDRAEAASRLAKVLDQYRGKNPLVLAIPRGALPMGRIIAEKLGGELDVVLVHKLGAPDQPELAIGAIDETGHAFISPYAQQLNIPYSYIEEEKQAQLEVLRQRRALYTPMRPPISPQGRIVIILDDGIATGSTMIAALQALREKKPAKLIVATAVAPPDTVRRLAKSADEIVCLDQPPEFYAVGQFFEDFSQVSDEEAIEILAEFHPKTRGART